MRNFLKFIFCICLGVYPYFCAELVVCGTDAPEYIAYSICQKVCFVVITTLIWTFGEETT